MNPPSPLEVMMQQLAGMQNAGQTSPFPWAAPQRGGPWSPSSGDPSAGAFGPGGLPVYYTPVPGNAWGPGAGSPSAGDGSPSLGGGLPGLGEDAGGGDSGGFSGSNGPGGGGSGYQPGFADDGMTAVTPEGFNTGISNGAASLIGALVGLGPLGGRAVNTGINALGSYMNDQHTMTTASRGMQMDTNPDLNGWIGDIGFDGNTAGFGVPGGDPAGVGIDGLGGYDNAGYDGTGGGISSEGLGSDPGSVGAQNGSDTGGGLSSIGLGPGDSGGGGYGVGPGADSATDASSAGAVNGSDSASDSAESGGGGGGGKVICAELYRQGLMPQEIYFLDEAFGDVLGLRDPAALRGYQRWAQPIADRMRTSPRLTKWARRIAWPWVEQMAYDMSAGRHGRDTLTGRFMMWAGLPLCRLIGSF